MARDTNEVFLFPAAFNRNSGDLITAENWNLMLREIEEEQRAARAISTGGTGAQTASGARDTLGVTTLLAQKRNTADEVPLAEVTGLEARLTSIEGAATSLTSSVNTNTNGLSTERGRVDAIETTLNTAATGIVAKVAALETGKLDTGGTIPTTQVQNLDNHIKDTALAVVSGTGSVTATYDTSARTLSIAGVNTTYEAGSGLSLTGTTFAVSTSLAGVTDRIGPSANTYIHQDASDTSMAFGGVEQFRFTSTGVLHANNDIIGYSGTVSDSRLKKNIEKVTDALERVEALQGYTFTYKHDGRLSAGVMAEEVRNVFPSAVRETELPMIDKNETYSTVQYAQLTALFIEAIKELSARVKELEANAG